MGESQFSRRRVLLAGGGALGAAAFGMPGARAATSGPGSLGGRTASGLAGRPWPTQRGNEALIRGRFPDRADLVARSLYTGDPLADAVVEELNSLGKPGRSMLQAGIKDGLASLSAPPPAIAAFLRETEAAVSAARAEDLERGSRAFFTVPVMAHSAALSLGSLVHTYSAPIPSGILVRTDKLLYTAKRRLLETSGWLARTMLPGGLARGADGYMATLQVRMLHAKMRADALRSNWDLNALGTPICQMDTVRTWLDFTYVGFNALAKLGFEATDEEMADIYRLWWTVGRLLGIDPGFYRDITTHTQARELLELTDATNEAPDANSRALVKATMSAVVDLSVDHNLPRSLSIDLVNSLMRLINGEEITTLYAVPRNALFYLLPAGVESSQRVRDLQRVLPDQWANQIRQNIKDAQDFLASQPQGHYQTHLDAP